MKILPYVVWKCGGSNKECHLRWYDLTNVNALDILGNLYFTLDVAVNSEDIKL